MNRRYVPWLVGGGCLLLTASLVFLVVIGLLLTNRTASSGTPNQGNPPSAQQEEAIIPTATPRPPSGNDSPFAPTQQLSADTFNALYQELHPGVVNIQVLVQSFGEGAGSGFIYDDQGHIVTNNHVIAGASRVIVTFYDGSETEARIIGTDEYSDLAVIQVDELPDGTHPLPLGDSTQVKPGEWVLAIGNPFGLGGSMSVGIVSAVGRSIASGVTAFDIPEAIQTDAAINPGNSGGPLLNMRGEVIGVNAQIATSGVAANAGVGFAIPARAVQQVIPALIRGGSYQWPWLGIRGNSVDLFTAEANQLEKQRGAYVHYVEPNGPAEQAGLQGSTETRLTEGLEVPVGGDVIIAIDGREIRNFADLLAEVAYKSPDETVELTILRNGQERTVTATLAPRPSTITP
ncbi:MAG: PDZ domain-containing protein [Chloroflexi bacterium]|nr:PDZ domain-containing protein [Chloroflexota bacterium]